MCSLWGCHCWSPLLIIGQGYVRAEHLLRSPSGEVDVCSLMGLRDKWKSPSCITWGIFRGGSGPVTALVPLLVGSLSGTALESHRALGVFPLNRVTSPGWGKGPWGASQGSLNSSDKGFADGWYAELKTQRRAKCSPRASLCHPAAEITASSQCRQWEQPLQLQLREEFLASLKAARVRSCLSGCP